MEIFPTRCVVICRWNFPSKMSVEGWLRFVERSFGFGARVMELYVDMSQEIEILWINHAEGIK